MHVTFHKQIEQLLQAGRYVNKHLPEEWCRQDSYISAKLGSGFCYLLTHGTQLVGERSYRRDGQTADQLGLESTTLNVFSRRPSLAEA